MRYCTRCVLPDTRPGVTLDERGVCNACRHTEYKKTVDWKQRQKMFEKVCDKYRRQKNEYDCLIATSSGKDSFFQVYYMTQVMHMNPLLANVDNTDWTKTGLGNLQRMIDAFGVDCITLRNGNELNKKMSRIGFEHDGFLYWLFDRLIYTYPLHMAIKFNIPLVIYGENTSVEYGGPLTQETPSAIDQIKNDVVRDYGWDLWTKNGVSMDDLNMALMPTRQAIEDAHLDPQYMSYYMNWSGYDHMLTAKKWGWKSLGDTGEWNRIGFIEDYEQIDDYAYLVDPWMKWPKYGHARVTDMASKLIRDGRMTREDAVKLVKEREGKLDPIALEHYLKFSGYSQDEFWAIVEKFYNRKIFDKTKDGWQLKNPIWKQGKLTPAVK